MTPLLPSESGRTVSPPWPDLAPDLPVFPLPLQIQTPEHAPWPCRPHLEPRLRMQDHGASLQLHVQQGLQQEGQGHRAPVHLEEGGRRKGDVGTDEWAADSTGPTFPGSSALLTVTALSCSSRTATSPSSTATSPVQATPLRPRLSLVTCTLWRQRPRCGVSGDRCRELGRRQRGLRT